MRIRTLADLAGTTPKAIRHYERLGLLGAVPRQGRYRTFDASHLEAVLLVQRARRFGFGLRELAGARDDDGTLDWSRLAGLVQQRQTLLAVERRRLQALEKELAAAAAELAACDRAAAHPRPAACLQHPQAAAASGA